MEILCVIVKLSVCKKLFLVLFSIDVKVTNQQRKNTTKIQRERNIFLLNCFCTHIEAESSTMAGVAKLFDGNILNKSKDSVDLNDDKFKGKTIGLYFSAHWYHVHFIFIFFSELSFLFVCLFS